MHVWLWEGKDTIIPYGKGFLQNTENSFLARALVFFHSITWVKIFSLKYPPNRWNRKMWCRSPTNRLYLLSKDTIVIYFPPNIRNSLHILTDFNSCFSGLESLIYEPPYTNFVPVFIDQFLLQFSSITKASIYQTSSQFEGVTEN